MSAVCDHCSWACRPVRTLFIVLATLPFVLHCSESPAAIVVKMYPRGNHWAVGHLMGKKSIQSLAELQETHPHNDLTPSDSAEVTELDQYEPLIEALMQQKKHQQMKTETADRREEDRDKYLREVSGLLRLALKLQGKDSD